MSCKKAHELRPVSKQWQLSIDQLNKLSRLFNIPQISYAALRGKTNEIVELKLQGYSTQTLDKCKLTPLHYAAIFNQSQALKLLLSVPYALPINHIKELKKQIPTLNEQSEKILLKNKGPKEIEAQKKLDHAITEKDCETIINILWDDFTLYSSYLMLPAKVIENITPLIQYKNQCITESSIFSTLLSKKNIPNSLLEFGIVSNINFKTYDCFGKSFIHYASMSNDLLPTLQKLLKINNSLIDQLTIFSKTSAPHYSIAKNAIGCMNYLINNGANGYILGVEKNTVLHTAAIQASLECLQELLKKYPDLINTKNQWGYTPLMYTVFLEKIPCLLSLIQHKADLNIACNKGLTALHIATQNLNTELMEHLLIRKANINHASNKNSYKECEGELTPLHYATLQNNIEAVKVLLQYNANKNLKTQTGKTALDLAIDLNFPEIKELLSF